MAACGGGNDGPISTEGGDFGYVIDHAQAAAKSSSKVKAEYLELESKKKVLASGGKSKGFLAAEEVMPEGLARQNADSNSVRWGQVFGGTAMDLNSIPSRVGIKSSTFSLFERRDSLEQKAHLDRFEEKELAIIKQTITEDTLIAEHPGQTFMTYSNNKPVYRLKSDFRVMDEKGCLRYSYNMFPRRGLHEGAPGRQIGVIGPGAGGGHLFLPDYWQLYQPRPYFSDFGGRGDGGKVKWYYVGHFRADRTAHFMDWVKEMKCEFGLEFEDQDVKEAICDAEIAITALTGGEIYKSMVSAGFAVAEAVHILSWIPPAPPPDFFLTLHALALLPHVPPLYDVRAPQRKTSGPTPSLPKTASGGAR